ncbi:hypothetical protein BD779DRAFT_1608026 [Infundibulicybe gibba]|nr:hypothetical protein BD779DRAFT_1608026 [Infundibulicybe gibba]
MQHRRHPIQSQEHDLLTSPIITRDAYIVGASKGYWSQYGVMGRIISTHYKKEVEMPDDPRLYVNTNAPFSAVVWSGKSHTLSVLLESMFLANFAPIGLVKKTLSGLVLHFGEGGPASRPRVTPPRVKVFVGLCPLGGHISVEPLVFQKSELDAQAFLSMMAVGSSDSAPLYVQIILSILRQLGEDYSYTSFMVELEKHKTKFNPAQKAGLEQRMSLLESFMDKSGTKKKASKLSPGRFAAGQLTIIDLSDPFIDPAAACGLFEVVTRLFVRADTGTGKVLVVDEAHKYLSSAHGSSSCLTKSLLSLTRQQRHLAIRVIISTQEPTVIPPVLLDLCTVTILHRFSSPSWWDHLTRHVSAEFCDSDAFDKVVKLQVSFLYPPAIFVGLILAQTGEAIVLAPSGIGLFHSEGNRGGLKTIHQFGRRYFIMKTRRRVTADGGSSVLVVNSSGY